jgi:hypothetical protein
VVKFSDVQQNVHLVCISQLAARQQLRAIGFQVLTFCTVLIAPTAWRVRSLSLSSSDFQPQEHANHGRHIQLCFAQGKQNRSNDVSSLTYACLCLLIILSK